MANKGVPRIPNEHELTVDLVELVVLGIQCPLVRLSKSVYVLWIFLVFKELVKCRMVGSFAKDLGLFLVIFNLVCCIFEISLKTTPVFAVIFLEIM